MDTDRDALAEAARRALDECGPLALEDLAATLTAEGLDLGADPVGLLEEVLLDEDWVCDLLDGRLVDVERLLDGLTLTHRLDAGEAAGWYVMVEPDLSPLLAVGELALPDGGAAWISYPEGDDLSDECLLVGSPGWLGGAVEGDLLVFRLDDGCLHVGPVHGELADPTAVCQGLASAFDEVSEDGEPVEGRDLIVTALADAPELLSSPNPLPPLGQLYAEAGLETCGEWVGLAGQEWELEDPATTLRRQVWGLDHREAQALGILLIACELADDMGVKELAANPETVAMLSEMLSLEGVAEAFVGSMLGGDLDHEPAVTAFAETLTGADGGSAAAHYVLSRCAEHRSDVRAGEAHLAAALAVDPEFEPALLDAAWYADDRGDAARALGYLRDAGIGEDDEQVLLLRRFAARGPAAAGRNEPCPCGSGRKHKVCCSRRNGHPLPERAGWLQRKAIAFLLRPTQRYGLREVARAYAGSDADDATWIDAALHDPLTQDLALFDTDVFASFLDVRGALLPADELELARSWVGLARSVYDVTDVRPGEGLRLRDLRTGERLNVTERLARLVPGTVLYARVAPDGRGHQLLGCTITIESTLREELMAFLDAKPGPEEVAAWFGTA